jgi:hypothetical protein
MRPLSDGPAIDKSVSARAAFASTAGDARTGEIAALKACIIKLEAGGKRAADDDGQAERGTGSFNIVVPHPEHCVPTWLHL